MLSKVFTCLIINFFFSIYCLPQTSNEAAKYLNLIGQKYDDIRKETWDYTSTMAHGRSARKVENKRTVLLKTIGKSIKDVKKMPAFDNDYSLRDSVISFLTLNFNVLNNDFEKIIDMEEVAEQSYDLMEAYLLAQEKANSKLEVASKNIDAQYTAFANKYGVTLIENKDKISVKLKKASEAIKYYNKIYLVFFKAYKQEMYLLEAIEINDINAIEQNRDALYKISEEGLKKLEEIKHFKGDNSVNSSCNRLIAFYKDEAATKIPIIADFLVISTDYDRMVVLSETKDRMLWTDEELKMYNNTIKEYKSGINKFNSTTKTLNTKRNSYITMWNNSVSGFMARHIPKK